MRESGILLPISSLPSKYGIGCFSKDAYEFIDFLSGAGQRYWQILPLGPTGYGDSPYQSFSTYAGNPYFIDPETLIEEGYLIREDCDALDFGEDSRYIDYEKLYHSRYKMLYMAYERFKEDDAYLEFVQKESFWLEDYCLYAAIKKAQGDKCWDQWDQPLKDREEDAIGDVKKQLADEIRFQAFLQYEFMKQWQAIHRYAATKGVKIIGDIPIYVAYDSSDTWANPELFQLDRERRPKAVAGCPPDAFSETGQLWGNPLYDWRYHKRTGYQWWIQRIAHSFRLYDVVRVDHFRGFDEYYAVPYGEETAINGKWQKGPGIALFNAIKKALGEVDIIAEDLGIITDSVRKLLDKTGYPGMKIVQFAFDGDPGNLYLPYNLNENSVIYTGTHDNDTLMGWYDNLSEDRLNLTRRYLNNWYSEGPEIAWEFIRMAQASVSKICIVPMQDYLCLGSEARINTPSTLGDNFKWRMEKGRLTAAMMKEIGDMAEVYGRFSWK